MYLPVREGAFKRRERKEHIGIRLKSEIRNPNKTAVMNLIETLTTDEHR
jgi:hypothetical protein